MLKEQIFHFSDALYLTYTGTLELRVKSGEGSISTYNLGLSRPSCPLATHGSHISLES